MRALLVVILVGAAAIGKRVCLAPMPTPIDGITVWSGLATAAIKIPRTVPAEQRRALVAGCNAAR